MPVDARRIETFLGANAMRKQIAAVFTRAGFEIVWVTEEAQGSRWGLYLKLPRRLRSVFGTAREVLVWVVQSSEFQARTVTQAAKIIERERPRLCEDFAIVITSDKNTELHASETAESLDTIFLGFCTDDFKLFEPWGTGEFVRALQQRLYSRDLYDLPTAATRSEDFFGRRSMVTEIATRLRSGGRHIGLFGLRKIGKTSLLYRLQSILKNGDSCLVAHVDIERIDAIEPSGEHLLWSLGEAIFDSHRQVRRVDGLLLFGKHHLFSLVPDKTQIFELFDHDLRRVLTDTNRQIVLMFDEIEILSTGRLQPGWGDSFVRVWRLLRGLDQQIPQRLSYFVTGTNPSMFEQNRLV